MIRNHIIYNNYLDWSFDIAEAEESYLWTTSGQQLIDFTSGWNTTNLGWNHPEAVEALVVQAKKNAYAPMWTSDPAQEVFCMIARPDPKYEGARLREHVFMMLSPSLLASLHQRVARMVSRYAQTFLPTLWHAETCIYPGEGLPRPRVARGARREE